MRKNNLRKGGKIVIEGLIQIGGALPLEEGSLSNLIQEISPTRRNKKLNVLKINFDTENDKLIFDVYEEMDDNTSVKYNFIGSASGPNSPQWYTSSTMINYHITETIFNLSKLDLGSELNKKIQEVLNNYYCLIDKSLPDKYKYGLNVEKYNISNIKMGDIYSQAKEGHTKPGDIGKSIISILSKEVDNYLKEDNDMGLNDFGLFTLLINGEVVAQNKEYIRGAIKSKEPKIKTSKTDKGSCSICGAKEEVSMDMTKTKVKLYTTNQIIFASNLDKKNYYKNMQMCKPCISKYLAGENYIQNKLRTKLSTFDVYIIPQFIYGKPLNEEELDRVTEKVVTSFNTVKSFSGIEEMRKDIVDILDFKNVDGYFLLNFMFYKSIQASTKVQAFIKDVNPSIFERLAEASINSYLVMREVLGINYKGKIDLTTVYYMNPVRLKRGDPSQYRDVLQTYDSILTGRKLNRKNTIKNIVECVKIIRFEKEPYNINPQENILEFYVLRANMYIKFLEHMKSIKGGINLVVENLNVKEDFKSFINKMGYDEEQTAMFLLGSLIGEIGNVQYKKSEGGSKPILNKLNFNGIDKSKIIRLTKDVFNKLNQEKIRTFNEVTFFEMKRLLDKNLKSWSLDKDENLFYVLSGYSFITTKPMLKGDKNEQ
jgi:CRISPR-associated protein Csh1